MAKKKGKKKKKKERVNNRYTPEFKKKVVLEYLKTKASLHQLADKYDIYPQMIVRWKKKLREEDKAIRKLKKPTVARKKKAAGKKGKKGRKGKK